ncbi:CvpA family protein [Candidatus Uhrbacteria bacterium]|nr:CvpA family protein [Candidatus Uhrbacteria bacterium]
MGFIDIVLIVIVGAFVFFGLFFGLVHTIGALLGTILGIVVASHFVEPTFDAFGFLLGGGSVARIIIFIILFLVVSRLMGVVLWFVEKIFGFFSIIPFAGTINRLLGAVLGLIEGIVVVGVVLFYAMQVLPQDTLLAALDSSVVANFLLATVSALQILFPETLRSTS